MGKCAFIKSKRFPGYIVCVRGCGVRLPIEAVEGVANIYSECRKTEPSPELPRPPDEGPGTELKKLLKELGFDESVGCGCAAEVARMNALGPRLCLEQIDSIAEKLEANAKLQSWWALAKAGAIAASMGIFSVRQLILKSIERDEARTTRLKQESAGQPAASEAKVS